MSPDEERFRALYRDHFRPLLAYAVRRVAEPADAADVVAETFLVAWRRLDQAPFGPQARPWLYGVARRVLANHHRGRQRRLRLADRLGEQLRVAVPEPAGARELAVHEALATLSETDQEVLRLSAWEQLEPREIAVVLDVSATSARAKVSRARRRLRDALGHDPDPGGHVVDVRFAPEEER